MVVDPSVAAVHRDPDHRFSKVSQDRVTVRRGSGVVGDAHAGVTVQHRSRVAVDPTRPNLRQVHLMHAELFEELRDQGFEVAPGQLGENVTTQGLDLLGLSRGARLRLGATVVLEVTGLRNPCVQLNAFQPGLSAALAYRDVDGRLVRKAGIMAIVIVGGDVACGDAVRVEAPRGPHEPLDRV